MGNAIKIKKNNEEYFLIDKYKNPFMCSKNNIIIFKINLLKEYIDKYDSLPPHDYKLLEPEIIDLGVSCTNKILNLNENPDPSSNIFIYDENEKSKQYLLGDIDINIYYNNFLKLYPENYEKIKSEFNNLNVNEKKNKIMTSMITSIMILSMNPKEKEAKNNILKIINNYYESIIIINNNEINNNNNNNEINNNNNNNNNNEINNNNKFIIFIIIFFIFILIFIIILFLYFRN